MKNLFWKTTFGAIRKMLLIFVPFPEIYILMYKCNRKRNLAKVNFPSGQLTIPSSAKLCQLQEYTHFP